MMAAKARLFKDHSAVELIMSPDPSAHKRIGRGGRNFDSAAWDREKQNAMLSGTYARFTQNPAMKHHLLSTGNKRLAEACPLDPVRALVSGRMIPEPKAHASGEGKFCSVRRFLQFAKKFATLRPGWHTRPPFVGSVFPRKCWNTRKFVRAAVVLADRGQRLPRSSLGVSVLFLGRAGRPKPGSFGDSFWRRPWPCAVRTRPLHRRGYCDAINRRRFVHHQICKT